MARRLNRYVYNSGYVGTVVEVVREVLRFAERPMSISEIAAEVSKFGVASYDTEDAVRVVVSRMKTNGEVLEAND